MKYCVEALISVANSTIVSQAVPLPICHLLKLLDYFLHHLSIPPQDLFKQVCCDLVSNIEFEHYHCLPFFVFVFCLFGDVKLLPFHGTVLLKSYQWCSISCMMERIM